MLSELRIRNYALIDDLTVSFGPGLNIISGETGAGKSILLGALSLVLGERPDPTAIRSGADSATVEARFDGPDWVAEACRRLGIDAPGGADAGLILRRRAERAGRTAAYANDAGLTVASLHRVGDRLVDLHGQHQHQLLLQPEVHREIVDAYARLAPELERYRQRYEAFRAKQAELAALEAEARQRQERRELTEYQYRELTDADIRPGEPEALAREKVLLDSAERRYALARELENVLSEQEGSVGELLGGARRRLEELSRIDESLAAHRPTLADAESACDDLWRELVRYRESIDFSPDRLEEVNARLFRIEKLEKKHGVGSGELAALTARLKQELEAVEGDAARGRELAGDVERDAAGLVAAAAKLSGRRNAAKGRLETGALAEFRALGLEGARLEVAVRGPGKPAVGDLGPNGCDDIEFLFSANPGEPLLPLRKVASGGELSRVMLGLKSVLAGVDLVPTMVFDEIDVGIGGRVAEAVGRRLARLGRNQQVICITHLPQIAKFADHHFLVAKSTRRGRTSTAIHPLDREGRMQELARMAAGETVTDASLAHAREMLEAARDEQR